MKPVLSWPRSRRILFILTFFTSCSLSLLLTHVEVYAQERTMAVLSPRVYVGDAFDGARLAEMLRSELRLDGRYTILAGSLMPDAPCDEFDCAVTIGQDLKATHVVYSNVKSVGRERVWTFTLVDVAGEKEVFTADLIKPTLSDMEAETSWVARSILSGRRALTSRQLDYKVDRDGKRRRDTILIGLGLGQLYPTSGYYSRVLFSGERDTLDWGFVFDARVSLFHEKYLLSFLISGREAFVVNLGGSYFLTSGQIAPYVGGSLGFSFAFEDDPGGDIENLSGFNIMGSAGLWFLRKRSIQAYINTDYMMVLNSRGDQGVALTIGIVGQTDAFGL